MTKVAAYMLAWSSSQQAYELSQGPDRAALNIILGSPAWFSWLAQISSFAFAGQIGSYTARKETKHGDVYWYAYRRTGTKLAKKYLGKTTDVTLARLEHIAGALSAQQAVAGHIVQEMKTPPLENEHVLDKSALYSSPTAILHADASVDLAPRAPPGMQYDPLNPLLATKLHMPLPRTQLVPRSHLIEQLQQGVMGVLTLISAPAGFGKTTLLCQWLARSGMPVAWLSLETEDNEPTRFLSYVIAALQQLDPGIGTMAFTLMHAPQPAPLETVLAMLINDIMSRNVGAFALVLDDYHAITVESIHYALTSLLEHLPPQMHLIIVTRADPPLPLSRLRARGQLTELRAAELRFATDEAGAFLRTMGLDLPAEAIATLQSRTEGWIAGLQFAALSLRGRTNVSEFLNAFTGGHRFVLDYLSEEVLSRQPAPVQRFLLHTSILERLSGPLCDAVTGQRGGQATLEALDHANLFVISLDDERRWYRYHHLFAEVLRSRLLQQADATLATELHCRASAWYEQHEMLVEAIQHALAAPNLERAVRLIEQHGMSFALRGGVHTVLGWLNALPDAMVRTHARLCLYSAIMLMFTNQLEAAEGRLYDAEQSIQTDMPADQARVIQGWVAGIRANLALFSGDLAQCVAFSRQALELLPETEVTMRAAAPTGPAHAFLVSGDVMQASEDLVAATSAAVRDSGDLFAFLTSITLLARLQVLQGRLHQAAATYEQVMQVAPGQEMLRALVGSAGYYFGLGDLLREWNDLDAAEQFLAQGMELVRGILTVAAHIVTQGYMALARLQQARGDYSGALATLDAFARLARQRHFVPQLSAHGLAVQAQVELAQGNLTAAMRWVDASGLSADDELSYLHEREYLTLARIRIAQWRNDPAGPFLHDALFLLERLLEDAEAKARRGSVLEILILHALALHTQGDRVEALKTLERALVLAEPEGYIRLFVDEGPPMLALLRQVQTRGMVSGYITTLLAAFGGQPTEEYSLHPSRPGSLVEPLTEREREVLRLLVAGLANAAIAQELVITVGTVKRHVNSIYGKLGVNSRTQAIARAHALHLL